MKLAKGQDLEELEDEIVAIENEYRCTIDESTHTLFVVKAGGAHYTDVTRSETLHKGTHTTAEDLVEARPVPTVTDTEQHWPELITKRTQTLTVTSV